MHKYAAPLVVFAAAGCASAKAPRPTANEPLVERTDPSTGTVSAPWRCDETADWPMFQRDLGRTGASEAPPIDTPSVAWSRSIGIASWLDSPLIAGGRVLAPSSGQLWNRPDGGDGLYAFDLRSGDPLWFAATPADANGAAYEDCRVFVGDDAGNVHAFDARTGAVLWVNELKGKMYANPLPLGDVVIVGGEGGFVAALDARTGAAVWRREVGAAVRGGASADPKHIYVTTEGARVIALARADGSVAWTHDLRAPGVVSTYAAPTVADGKVYVSFVRDTYYDTPAIRVLDAETGARVWDARNSQAFAGGWGNVRSSPALHDGHLYWGEAYSNRIVGLEATDGDVTSSVAAGFCTFPHWPSPALAQEVVYVPRHDGGLYAYDINKTALRWSLYVGEANNISQTFPPEHEESGERCDWEPPFGRPVYASPAVAADGTVIVATGDGWLHAIRGQ